MHEAAKRGQVDFLRDCFQQRIPINGVDKSGSTPLYWAAHGGHDDCVKEILKHGNKVQLDVQVRYYGNFLAVFLKSFSLACSLITMLIYDHLPAHL